MALIVGGESIATPFPSRSWKDDARLRLAPADIGRRPRRGDKWSPVQIIVAHNTGNAAGVILPGAGPDSSREESTVAFWSRKVVAASAHLIIDYNGDVAQCADLWSEVTWHAGALNHRSIGVEIVQRASSPNFGAMHEIQMTRFREFCDWFMRRPVEVSVVQPQFPVDKGVVKRLRDGGADYYGVCGHCHQNEDKSRDPGPAVFAELALANYKPWTVADGEDLRQWARRQTAIGVKGDGLPGPTTRRALMVAGYPDGLCGASSW